MNLEQLRKQAKELVKDARAGDADALERLGGREPILARAQLVVAREHGYPSWPALVAAAEASVERSSARRPRAARPGPSSSSRPGRSSSAIRGCALVLGRGWDGDANAPGGPLECPPLVYACHSCFDTSELARELLGARRRPERLSSSTSTATCPRSTAPPASSTTRS